MANSLMSSLKRRINVPLQPSYTHTPATSHVSYYFYVLILCLLMVNTIRRLSVAVCYARLGRIGLLAPLQLSVYLSANTGANVIQYFVRVVHSKGQVMTLAPQLRFSEHLG